MTAKTLFDEKVPAAIQKSEAKLKEINATFLFKISGENGGTWTLNLKDSPIKIESGEKGPADCTIEMADADFEKILKDSSAAMQLYFQGKLKVAGNVLLATRLQSLFSLV